MIKNNLTIEGIPAILWGEPSDILFIAVHGNMSSKDDDAIVIFAEEATNKGYQILSFDLPEHGDRKGEDYACKVQNCVSELTVIMGYAQAISSDISLFACSMGSYFSLLAYRDLPLKQCLFLSPVLNMERIINNMMVWFDISEDRLKAEKVIETPIGQTLSGSECDENDDYLLTVIRYIHNNTVKAGMVQESEEYRWSSIHAYYGIREYPNGLSD